MKYKTILVSGHWQDDPSNNFDVTVALDEWDGECDAEDERIFYYMDGESIKVGSVIADDFVVTDIYED